MSGIGVTIRHPRRRSGAGMSPTIALACAFLALVVVLMVFGRALAPHDPAAQDLNASVAGPSAHAWLGTDELGRDLFSRTMAGALTAVVGPLIVAVVATLIGNVLGLVAGYRGGWMDAAIMRTCDLVYALPSLLIAIVVVGVVGGGYGWSVAILTVLYVPYTTRVVRASALEQRPLPYVEAARTLGLSRTRIIFRHIWPNVLPVSVAHGFLTFGLAIVSLSALSFLGLGVAPGTADWGRMLAESQNIMFANAAAPLGPGLMIVGTAASMNLLGDWIFERLSDRGRVR